MPEKCTKLTFEAFHGVLCSTFYFETHPLLREFSSLLDCDRASWSWQTILQRELRRTPAWERRICVAWFQRDVGRLNDAVLSAIQPFRFDFPEDDSADRFERLSTKGLNLDYFIAESALQWKAGLTGSKRPYCVIQRRFELTMRDVAEVTAFFSRIGVIGLFERQGAEIGAVCELDSNPIGFCLGFCRRTF